jgi:hypothetical protein
MVTTIAKTYAQGISTQQQKVEKILEEHKDIFSSPTMVTLHCEVKHSIDFTPIAPLSNGPVYMATSDQTPHLVGAQLFWYRRRTGHENFILIIEP